MSTKTGADGARKKGGKMVTIRLTAKQADLVWRNVDGWLDAGACEGGLRPDENRALQSLARQLLAARAGERP
jgi:hypothetical protein